LFPDTSIELIKFEALFDECLKEVIQASQVMNIIRILSQKNSLGPFYQKRKSFEKKKWPATHSYSPGKMERDLLRIL